MALTVAECIDHARDLHPALSKVNVPDELMCRELTRAVSDAVSVPVIASGGVGTLDDLADGIQLGRADAVLAASIFHYGEFTVAQAKARMAERGIPVRL